MCTEESHTDITQKVEQFKFIAVEKDDGVQTVMKTIIKVSSHTVSQFKSYLILN